MGHPRLTPRMLIYGAQGCQGEVLARFVKGV